MDVFERLFGVSPDGGTGSLEETYIAVSLLAVSVIAARRHIVALIQGITEIRRGKRDAEHDG